MNLRGTNLSDTKPVHYTSWQGREFPLGQDNKAHAIVLQDEHGNKYYGETTGSIGVTWSGPIYPHKEGNFDYTFDPPVEAAKILTLRLPASNLGEEGEIMLRFKVAEIKDVRERQAVKAEQWP